MKSIEEALNISIALKCCALLWLANYHNKSKARSKPLCLFAWKASAKKRLFDYRLKA